MRQDLTEHGVRLTEYKPNYSLASIPPSSPIVLGLQAHISQLSFDIGAGAHTLQQVLFPISLAPIPGFLMMYLIQCIKQ